MRLLDALFNRRLLAMAIGLLIVAGLSAIQNLPRQEDPRIINRNATVLTHYPGADPARVEALVSKPLEDALRTIAEIGVLESTSRQGISIISIELVDEVTDVTPLWSRIRDRLADAEIRLPADSDRPTLIDDRGYAFTMVTALRWTLDTPPNLLILGRYAHQLGDRFRSLPGTDYTDVFGAGQEVVEVLVDPLETAALGLSVDQVAAALAAADARQTAGDIITGTTRQTLELAGTFGSLDQLRDVAVTTRDGQAVRVGELAGIRRGLADPPSQLATLDNRTVVMVGARMAGGQRVDRWVERASLMVGEFNQSLPLGVEAEIIFEQAGYTSDRLSQVVNSLLAGLLIVVGILFLTLGWRGAITVGLAIPATALLALALFPLVGLQIHQMSVTGLIVALGLMVDNAIVVTNALRERLRLGDEVRTAAAGVLRRLAAPLFASTVTTILAFMPIVLLPGAAGEFVGPLALAVILALISSYVVALMLIPALAPLLLRGGGGAAAGPVRANVLGNGFRRLIVPALKRPGLTLVAACSLPLIGMGLLPTVPVSFFPPADRDQFQLELRLPASASIAETARMAAAATDLIEQVDGVRHVWFVMGSNAPMVYYNQLPTDDSNPAFAHGIVDTDSLEATSRIIPALQQTLDAALPGAQIVVRKYEQGPPFQAPLELRVYGSDLETLARLGEEIALRMHQLPQVTHARSLVQRDVTKVVASLDREVLQEQGLAPDAVAGQLAAALSGRQGGFLLEQTEQLPVLVRYPQGRRDGNDGIAEALLSGASTGDGIPLGSVAGLRTEPAWGSVQRRGGERVQVIRAYLQADALPADAMSRLEQVLEQELELPAGYRLETGGEASERGEAVGRLLGSVLLLVILMVATVTTIFNSFRRAAIVFAAGAQAMGLGLLALVLSGHTFGFVIIIGIMGLVGVAINATIIMISALDQDADARTGDPDAMARVVTGTTCRHISSTTITTVGGLIPLMLTAGDFWPPFAQTVGGGLLLATVIAFFATPAAYRLLLTRRHPAPDTSKTGVLLQ